jgi:hypothetical protein
MLKTVPGDSNGNLFTVYAGGTRRIDRQPHGFAFDAGDRDPDAAIDHDRLALLAG